METAGERGAFMGARGALTGEKGNRRDKYSLKGHVKWHVTVMGVTAPSTVTWLLESSGLAGRA